ncbi:hypothetical protein DMA15_12620 [Streptomyces sp. WAC 01529]|uniref:hypothetical protein n=1 Tax=Streptomyces sp. WAC 01529 TaxID=2203205 RepID=UPI000F6BD1B4|nr:hypothetical protein [Streptomyces sp. WAC 01529]AZM53326.1 hypothetical protein DMA15_12620 [Streptomyces sp. WAC 01529]
MRVRLTDGTREVEIRTDGSTDDPALLRQIERTARRLLDAMPAPPHTTSPTPFGFGRQLDLDRVALDSTLERSDQDEDDLDDEDDET